MKTIKWLVLSLILAAMVSGCFTPPEYPNTPEITFDNIRFVETPKVSDPDSLILTLDFKDGDGDMGLAENELGDGKYAERFYFKVGSPLAFYLNDPTQVNQVAKDQTFIRYKTKRTNKNYDTLPAFVMPYSCTNWEVVTETQTDGTQKTIDTLYFRLNPNHYNIFVDFLVVQNDGSYAEYDFRENLCTTYDGRIPILSKDVGQATSLEGTIRYTMPGRFFLLTFGNKSLKLRVKIQDRQLNVSNVVETPPFALSDIK